MKTSYPKLMKRENFQLKKLKNSSWFFSLYKKYMFFVGIAGQSMFYAQFYQLLKTKSAANVSLFGFLCGLISVASWLIYGLWIKDRILIFANVIGTLGAVLTIGAILWYSW